MHFASKNAIKFVVVVAAVAHAKEAFSFPACIAINSFIGTGAGDVGFARHAVAVTVNPV